MGLNGDMGAFCRSEQGHLREPVPDSLEVVSAARAVPEALCEPPQTMNGELGTPPNTHMLPACLPACLLGWKAPLSLCSPLTQLFLSKIPASTIHPPNPKCLRHLLVTVEVLSGKHTFQVETVTMHTDASKVEVLGIYVTPSGQVSSVWRPQLQAP